MPISIQDRMTRPKDTVVSPTLKQQRVADSCAIEIDWRGPCSLLPRGPRGRQETKGWEKSGVYIIGITTKTGFLPWWVGFTTKKFTDRLFQHPKEFLNGSYAVLDVRKMAAGKKKVIWKGGYYWSSADSRHWRSMSKFVDNLPDLASHLRTLLQSLQVVLGPIAGDRRVLERVEASIMKALFQSTRDQRWLYSEAMLLRPRREMERSLLITNRFPCVMRGISQSLLA